MDASQARVTTFSESSSSASLPSFKWNWKRRVALLRLYTIYKRELSSSNINEQSMWKKISDEVGKKSPYSPDAKQCRNQIHEIKSEYEKKKNSKPTDQFSATVLDEAENAFENTENPYVFSLQSNLEKADMRKPDRAKLLQVYTKYKAELSLQNFGFDQQIIWGKVARELSKICCSFYGKRRCCYEINNLKFHYELFKKKKSETCPKPYFFEEARKAFESTQCTDTSSAESTNTVSLPWKKRLVLLKLYATFKKELSSSEGMDEESVWQRISERVGACDTKQCRNQIRDMKCEYERMKNLKPYELSNEEQAAFLDEAENAFENIENPVVFSVQSDLKKWTMSKPDRVTLLQVYARYKSELPLQNFDVEQQIVWEKVAREVSAISSSFYGKRRCCYEINSFKKRYEKQSGKKDFLFDEIRKTFEAA